MLCGLPLLAAQASAQAWPAKAIKLVVPFPPGGPTDTASRILGEQLALRLKQPVVVENKAGASGAIAAAQVAKTPGDGYTFMMLATPTLLAPHMYKSVAYDTVKDFVPVATVYDLPIVMVVNPQLMPTVTDVQKLVTHAKARPGQLSYTSSGVGSFGNLSMELLKQLGNFDMQHVAYKGGVPAITDTIGGQVPDDVRRPDRGAAARPVRPAACHRGRLAPARERAAGGEDGGGAGLQGLRRRLLGRPAGPQGHAAGRDRPSEQGSRRHPGRQGRAGTHAQGRCHRQHQRPRSWRRAPGPTTTSGAR